MELKVVALADTHGYLPKIKEDSEVMLIAGDIVPLSIQRYNKISQQWVLDEFCEWAMKQPVDKVFVIPGNHDWGLYIDDPEFTDLSNKLLEQSNNKIVLLKDNIHDYKGFRLVTSPWCKQFYNWAYMLSDAELTKKFNGLLEKNEDKPVDILLTHDAPYGVSDQLLESTAWNPIVPGPHIGNKPLAEFVKKLKPAYHFHGHLHSTNHEKEMFENTEVYNVSIVNEMYETVFEPLYLTLTKEEKEN